MFMLGVRSFMLEVLRSSVMYVPGTVFVGFIDFDQFSFFMPNVFRPMLLSNKTCLKNRN